jgi:hypothetical protein
MNLPKCISRVCVLSLLMMMTGAGNSMGAGHRAEPRGRVTEAKARRAALATVANGAIQSSELEKEKGILIWSFDIRTPGTRAVTEVHVDARTGKVISKSLERPDQEAIEKKAELPKRTP